MDETKKTTSLSVHALRRFEKGGREGTNRSVHSSVVDGDANGPGEVSLDTGGLELSQGETTSKLDSGVVLKRRGEGRKRV